MATDDSLQARLRRVAAPRVAVPPSAAQRAELEDDLISFCDRALDLLGDVCGLRALYAGGASPLWLEGLAERLGPEGYLAALEADVGRVEEARRWAAGEKFPCPVEIVTGDVFAPPFETGTFDLVYSAGLLHELDANHGGAEEAIRALVATLRPGGRLATDDFVDVEPAAQLEDEALEAELRRVSYGEESYGIGPAERLVSLHRSALEAVSWRVLPPFGIRHLDRNFLAEPEPHEPAGLPEAARVSLRERRRALRERVALEGYTRPATLYVEGRSP